MRTAPRLMGNVSHAVNSVSSGHAGQKACTAYATSKSANISEPPGLRNHNSAASVDVAKSDRIESGSASSLNVAFPLDPHRSARASSRRR